MARTWIVTGCSSGLGRAIALEALAAGERVALTARNPDALAELVGTAPDRARAFALDVADPASVEAAFAAVRDWAGSIDVLVNNAGYGLYCAVEEASDDEIRNLFETNIYGVARTVRAALPEMRKRGSGAIVNIGSVAGIVGGPGNGFYAASKFAIEALSEALHAELTPLGIQTLLIDPSGIRSDFHGRSYKRAETRLPEYEATAGDRIGKNLSLNGKQAGDPHRMARTIIRLVGADDAPMRLLVGGSCVDRVRGKLTTMLDQIATWEEVSRSVDFEAPEYPASRPLPANPGTQ